MSEEIAGANATIIVDEIVGAVLDLLDTKIHRLEHRNRAVAQVTRVLLGLRHRGESDPDPTVAAKSDAAIIVDEVIGAAFEALHALQAGEAVLERRLSDDRGPPPKRQRKGRK